MIDIQALFKNVQKNINKKYEKVEDSGQGQGNKAATLFDDTSKKNGSSESSFYGDAISISSQNEPKPSSTSDEKQSSTSSKTTEGLIPAQNLISSLFKSSKTVSDETGTSKKTSSESSNSAAEGKSGSVIKDSSSPSGVNNTQPNTSSTKNNTNEQQKAGNTSVQQSSSTQVSSLLSSLFKSGNSNPQTNIPTNGTSTTQKDTPASTGGMSQGSNTSRTDTTKQTGGTTQGSTQPQSGQTSSKITIDDILKGMKEGTITGGTSTTGKTEGTTKTKGTTKTEGTIKTDTAKPVNPVGGNTVILSDVDACESLLSSIDGFTEMLCIETIKNNLISLDNVTYSGNKITNFSATYNNPEAPEEVLSANLSFKYDDGSLTQMTISSSMDKYSHVYDIEYGEIVSSKQMIPITVGDKEVYQNINYTYKYNDYGLITKITGKFDKNSEISYEDVYSVTELKYDSDGHLKHVESEYKITSTSINMTSITEADYEKGLLVKTKNTLNGSAEKNYINSITTSDYTYNKNGKLAERVDSTSTSLGGYTYSNRIRTSYEYANDGSVAKIKKTDNNGLVSESSVSSYTVNGVAETVTRTETSQGVEVVRQVGSTKTSTTKTRQGNYNYYNYECYDGSKLLFSAAVQEAAPGNGDEVLYSTQRLITNTVTNLVLTDYSTKPERITSVAYLPASNTVGYMNNQEGYTGYTYVNNKAVECWMTDPYSTSGFQHQDLINHTNEDEEFSANFKVLMDTNENDREGKYTFYLNSAISSGYFSNHNVLETLTFFPTSFNLPTEETVR